MELHTSVKIINAAGEPVLGNGAVWLLQHIAQTGSIRAAAAAMGMSYSKAWRIIRLLEGALGEPVLVRRKGGSAHGGAELTGRGQIVVAAFTAIRDDLSAYARRRHAAAVRRLFAVRRKRHVAR